MERRESGFPSLLASTGWSKTDITKGTKEAAEKEERKESYVVKLGCALRERVHRIPSLTPFLRPSFVKIDTAIRRRL